MSNEQIIYVKPLIKVIINRENEALMYVSNAKSDYSYEWFESEENPNIVTQIPTKKNNTRIIVKLSDSLKYYFCRANAQPAVHGEGRANAQPAVHGEGRANAQPVVYGEGRANVQNGIDSDIVFLQKPNVNVIKETRYHDKQNVKLIPKTYGILQPTNWIWSQHFFHKLDSDKFNGELIVNSTGTYSLKVAFKTYKFNKKNPSASESDDDLIIHMTVNVIDSDLYESFNADIIDSPTYIPNVHDLTTKIYDKNKLEIINYDSYQIEWHHSIYYYIPSYGKTITVDLPGIYNLIITNKFNHSVIKTIEIRQENTNINKTYNNNKINKNNKSTQDFIKTTSDAIIAKKNNTYQMSKFNFIDNGHYLENNRIIKDGKNHVIKSSNPMPNDNYDYKWYHGKSLISTNKTINLGPTDPEGTYTLALTDYVDNRSVSTFDYGMDK
jgi:hypothetical protein